MKIVTWNVNSLRMRLAHVGAFLDAHAPDVLLLQETKVEDAKFPRLEFESRGYHVAIHGQKSYNGVAIASKTPLTDVVNGFNGHVFNDHARLISATTNGVRVASVYVPNGSQVGDPKFTFKTDFMRELTGWMVEQTGRHPRVAIGGDFNIAWDERDVDDVARRAGECMFTPPERDWLHGFAATGLVDALRCVNDAAGVFSWWDYRELAFVKNRGMRIDYVFVSAALKGQVREVIHHRDERKRAQPSDHIPVAADVAL